MGRLSYSGNALTTFLDATAMDAADVNGLFLDLVNEDAIYNVINELDADATRGTNFESPSDIPEQHIQFYPFNFVEGTQQGGLFPFRSHAHEGTEDSGRELASDSVRTEQVDRALASMIYTGKPKFVLLTGEAEFTGVAIGASASKLAVNVSVSVGGVTWDTSAPAVKFGHVPVVIASIIHDATHHWRGYVWVQPGAVLSGTFNLHLENTEKTGGPHDFRVALQVFYQT